ncbi:MAG TPA: O-methyltransferase [Acidobacteriota bacterium]|nr:O-methyltransferase [Acidobacteriota bacterium]
MQIVAEAVENYLERAAGAGDEVLREMEAHAARHDFPIVGPVVGRILTQLALLCGARRVMELGSGFGYSAYWFAQAMDEKGELILTEYKSENLERASKWLTRGEVRPRVRLLAGDALDSLDRQEGPFDIVFCDIDKHDYPKALQAAVPKLRPGGLMITDNVLWQGKVAEEPPDPDDEALEGVLEYNRRAYERSDLWTVILPVRDGVAVSFKRP